MTDLFDLKKISKITGIALLIYLLSFLGYIFPFLNYLFFVAIFVVALYFTLKKLEYGVFILLLELIIGVKGYLFSVGTGNFVLSLRIALFAMVFLVWFIKKRPGKFKFFGSKFFPLYALFTVMILLGVIIALANGYSLKNIFFDVNGYFYLALIFILFTAIRKKEQLNKTLQVVIAGGLAISMLTFYCIAEFTIFHQESRPDMAEAISTEKTIEDEEVAGEKISHSTMAKGQLTEFNFRRDLTNQKPPIYRWLTDTGVGEISYLAGPFFRFFSAGQLYALIALALASAFLIKRTHQRRELLYLTAIVAINLTAVIIGFSRSLWLGLLATFAYLILNLPWKKTVRLILYSIGVASLAIILVGTLLPSVYDLMEKRVSSILHPAEEEASTNRFNLLEPVFEKVKEHPVLGSGFGTTVEYESVVPEKYGTLRVFAFEWSYLDTILEVGLLGLLIYLMLIFKVFKEGIKQQRQISGSDKIIIAGLLAALFGIVITNITTPYLNHPLGIGFLLLIITTLAIISKTQHASQSS